MGLYNHGEGVAYFQPPADFRMLAKVRGSVSEQLVPNDVRPERRPR